MMMKKYCIALFTGGLLFICTGFLSCQKIYDQLPPRGTSPINSCPIMQIAYQEPFPAGFADTLTFQYDTKGNPLSIRRPVSRTGAPNYLFKYKNGRLTDFIAVYDDGPITENWHQYHYDAKGRVSVDSVFAFAIIDNGKPSQYLESFSIELQYDAMDRIIQERKVVPGASPEIRSYSYNATGNLVGPNYDDKISYLRAHPIWMFLNRNYSVNNAYGATDFNANNMPIRFDNSNLYMISFLQNDFLAGSIRYACK